MGVAMHYSVENGLDLGFAGDAWRAAYGELPADTRHLAIHAGHLVEVSELDRPFVNGDLLVAIGSALPAEGWRARLAQAEAEGVTEVVYQPAGRDIARELESFAEAVRG